VSDIVGFLRARLDEDEQMARAAESKEWEGTCAVLDERGAYVAVGPYAGDMDKGSVAHIARWDPARVLAEVEAKRRIVELHPRVESRLMPGKFSDYCDGCHAPWPCPTLQALVQPYADHLDYEPAWVLASGSAIG